VYGCFTGRFVLVDLGKRTGQVHQRTGGDFDELDRLLSG
jgi:hypothetical protein